MLLKDRQISAIKRQFRNSLPIIKKIASLDEKINALNAEKAILNDTLEAMETGIKIMTNGYKSTDLIQCEYIPQFNEDGTPKMDKENKYQIKKQVLTFVAPNDGVAVESKEEELPVEPKDFVENDATKEYNENSTDYPFE